MKKILLVVSALVLVMSLSGCWIYGEGRSVGYITTVEDGIFWNTAFLRAELESSNTDAYAINKDNEALKDSLLGFANTKTRIEIRYKKHIMTSHSSNDEIVGYKIISSTNGQ